MPRPFTACGRQAPASHDAATAGQPDSRRVAWGSVLSGDPGETAANDVRHPRSILLPHLLHALDELGRVLLTGNREVSACIREKRLRVPRQVLPEPVPVATTTQVHPQPQRGQDVRRFLLEVRAAHRRIYPVNVTLSLLHQLVPGPAHRTSM